MSPKLKRLSGPEVLTILYSFGFENHSQRGSHAKLRRISETKGKQTLTILNHLELDIGTLKAIYRQALKYIPESAHRSLFYPD